MSDKKVLLQGRNIRKVYGSGESATEALKGVDVEIYDGELLVILGSSGSGKSTLLNMIGGMDKPTSGEILFNGKDICGYNDKKLTNYRKNNVGFIFQSFNLIQELTLRENVELTATHKDREKVVKEVFEIVGLSHKIDKYPSQLSGGEQQRVSIARALAKDSSFLLCDEPTGALDFETGKQILVELEKLVREYKKTVVIVTHTQEIANMADRTIKVRNGLITETIINDNPVRAIDVEW